MLNGTLEIITRYTRVSLEFSLLLTMYANVGKVALFEKKCRVDIKKEILQLLVSYFQIVIKFIFYSPRCK